MLEALWACYKPSGALRFHCADGVVRPFEVCLPVPIREAQAAPDRTVPAPTAADRPKHRLVPRLALLAQTGSEAKALLDRMDQQIQHRR